MLVPDALPCPYKSDSCCLKQCNDLLMVGKKTVNIGISLKVAEARGVGVLRMNLADAGKATSSKEAGQIDSAR